MSASRSPPTRGSSARSWPASRSVPGSAERPRTPSVRCRCSARPSSSAASPRSRRCRSSGPSAVLGLGEGLRRDRRARDDRVRRCRPRSCRPSAPMLVRATLTDVATSGSIVGRLSAIGTVGAITGTFLTGFVLLGLVPTRALIVSIGGRARRDRRGPDRLAAAPARGAAALAVVAVAADRRARARRAVAVRHGERLLLHRHRGRRRRPGRPDPRPRPPDARRTSTSPTRPTSSSATCSGSPTRPARTSMRSAGRLDVLHLGGGGFTFPRYLEATRPGARQTVLELDPRILEVAAVTELGFVPSDAHRGPPRRRPPSIRALPDDVIRPRRRRRVRRARRPVAPDDDASSSTRSSASCARRRST